MLGFPASDNYSGEGVFSHVCLRPTDCNDGDNDGSFNPVIASPTLNEQLTSGEVIKPIYEEGKEILLYSDATTYHTAPDVTNRAGVFRFM